MILQIKSIYDFGVTNFQNQQCNKELACDLEAIEGASSWFNGQEGILYVNLPDDTDTQFLNKYGETLQFIL